MIDYETLHEQAKWAEYKLAHPSLKSKIVEGLPKQEMDCREDREFYKDLADEYYTKWSKINDR